MMKHVLHEPNQVQPFSTKTVVFALCITVVALAVAAGYYQELYRQERIKLLRLQRSASESRVIGQPSQ